MPKFTCKYCGFQFWANDSAEALYAMALCREGKAHGRKGQAGNNAPHGAAAYLGADSRAAPSCRRQEGAVRPQPAPPSGE